MRKNTFVLFVLLIATRLGAQQIQVGTIKNGTLNLEMDDAKLTSTFAFILNGATLSDARISSATDSEGLFYYIAANGQRNGQSFVRVAIILSVIEDGVLAFIGSDGCEMECSAGPGCTACEQNIIVRCKSQTCACKEGTGGSNSRVTFSQ